MLCVPPALLGVLQYQAKSRLEQLLSQPPPEVAATQADCGDEDDGGVEADIVAATQAVADLGHQLMEKEEEREAAGAVEGSSAGSLCQ